MDNKTYILAISALSAAFLGQAEASMTLGHSGNPFERLNGVQMGPLDPRESDETENMPLPRDDMQQDDKE